MNDVAHHKPEAGERKTKNNPAQKGQKTFKPPKKITEKYLHNAGLHYLQRFPASSMHFKTVMMRKINKSCRYHTDQQKEDCLKHLDAVVSKFQELGLLDDAAYLKGMITSYRRRGLSQRQIQAKLSQKGYSHDQITAEVQQYDQETLHEDMSGDLMAAIIHARKKRLGPFDSLNKKDNEKTLAAIARAGFSYDIASKILEMDIEDAESLLNQNIL